MQEQNKRKYACPNSIGRKTAIIYLRNYLTEINGRQVEKGDMFSEKDPFGGNDYIFYINADKFTLEEVRNRVSFLLKGKIAIGWEVRIEKLMKVFVRVIISDTTRKGQKKRLLPYPQSNKSFFSFIMDETNYLMTIQKWASRKSRIRVFHSLARFTKGNDLALSDITCKLMKQYEFFLQKNGMVKNSTSAYMRVLKALYNKAVKQRLVKDAMPFDDVYLGVDKTVKRAITVEDLRRIKELDLTRNADLEQARDIFLFSFYTRGMSFVDIMHLKKTDLKCDCLQYHRQKTGQLIVIKWEAKMQNILDKYENSRSKYLLSFFPAVVVENYASYQSALGKTNRALHTIGKMAGIKEPLTTYVARHTWASVAHDADIPIAVISGCMGHKDEQTTQIYLSSLNIAKLHEANRKVIELL